LPDTSADTRAKLLDLLRGEIPHVFTEDKVDVEKLKAALGLPVAEGKERYGLTWAGKSDAFRNVQTVSNGTLAPMMDESVDWDTTGNAIVEGDNLEVLKLLQRPYHGKVKMIYIDPPYNTGNEFIYPDNFREGLHDYLRYSGQVNEEGFAQNANKDTSGRYHSNWLSMMYPRLFLARNLLRDDGVIFVSIDDHEVHNLRHLMDEVFGEENFVGTLVWKNVTDNNPTNVATEHEYLHVYARQRTAIEREWKSKVSDIRDLLVRVGEELTNRFKGEDLRVAYARWFKENKFELWPLDRYKYIDERGVYTGSQSVHNPGREGYRYDVMHPTTGKPCKLPLMGYRFPKATMNQMLRDGQILFGEDESKIIELKVYARDYQERLASVQELDGRIGVYELAELFPDDGRVFTNPKPVRLISGFMPFVLDSGELFLDFFAGSGTTAQAVLELNAKDGGDRKFILVQLPEKTDNPKFPTIADITRERVRRVIKKLKAAEVAKASAPQQASIPLSPDPSPAGGEGKESDLGFRAFRLAASNFRVWEAARATNGEALAEQIKLSADNMTGSPTRESLLYELILRAGLPPTSTVVDVTLPLANAPGSSNQAPHALAHDVNGGELLVCVERAVSLALVRALVALKPKRLVCLDKAFAGDDAAKTNALLEAQTHGVLFYTA
jgi:adenine-specific DNA-methyltransferase